MSLTLLLALPWRQRALLKRLVWREIVGRYRGAWLGLSWSVLTPLLMLVIYTFVFGVVFAPRVGAGGPGNHFDFALSLFAGLIVFNLFAEVVTRAPGLIVANPNYVKKVVFPLALLPLAALLAALFHAVVSLAILAAALAVTGKLGLTTLWLPLVWMPFLLMTAGFAWALAALGVFLRDLTQVVGMLSTALLFLSPVFYPVSALPPPIRPWLFMNPLTVPIEQTRAVLMLGQAPQWLELGVYGVIALVVAWAGLALFERTRPGFADVV